jgi:hypothetical protein
MLLQRARGCFHWDGAPHVCKQSRAVRVAPPGAGQLIHSIYVHRSSLTYPQLAQAQGVCARTSWESVYLCEFAEIFSLVSMFVCVCLWKRKVGNLLYTCKVYMCWYTQMHWGMLEHVFDVWVAAYYSSFGTYMHKYIYKRIRHICA